MKVRTIVSVSLALGAIPVRGAELPTEAVETDLADVKVHGYVGKRLDGCLRNNLVAMDTEMLTQVFRRKAETWNWDTEFWGKYMHAAVPLGRYLRSDEFSHRVAKGVDAVLAEQLPDGYIGNFLEGYRSNLGWDVWGNKYTLLGLLEFWRDTKEQRVLDGACRLADYVISQFPSKRPLHETGGYRGLASGSILEPFVWLYRATGERKYLDFAKYVVSELNDAENGPKLIDMALAGVDVADRPTSSPMWHKGGHKAYEMMSCYQGLLEYYEATGDRRCFEAALKTAENILATEENVCGGMATREFWYHGAREQVRPWSSLQETCVSTTWMRLCEKLLVLTGDPKWADAIERTFYNVYLASLAPDGSVFSTYCPLAGSRHEGHDQYFMRANCCNANGPRGVVAFLKTALTAEGTTVMVNHYLPMTAEIAVPGFGGEKFPISIDTHYPRTGRVAIRYDGLKPRRFTMKLRIPAWSDGANVSFLGIDGGPVKETEHGPVKPGAYYAITREWDPCEVMYLDFALKVVPHELDGYLAFTRGPITLARDLRFGDGDIGEALRADFGKDSAVFSEVESPDAAIWITCSAVVDLGHHMLHRGGPVMPSEIKFCDYASAGNTWDRRSSYRVWLPVEIARKHPLENQGDAGKIRPGDIRHKWER